MPLKKLLPKLSILQLIPRVIISLFVVIAIYGCALEQAKIDYKLTTNTLDHSYMTNSTGDVIQGKLGASGRRLKNQKLIEYLSVKADAGDSESQKLLGQMYLTGWNTPKDIGKGVFYTRLAAENGVSSAIHNLAWLYENGTGVEQDWEQAIKLYERAAALGDINSINNLGRIYNRGLGVAKNEATAHKFFRRAAENGSALAQYNLALNYRDGVAVSVNDSLASKYFSKACDQGLKRACEELKFLCRNTNDCGIPKTP